MKPREKRSGKFKLFDTNIYPISLLVTRYEERISEINDIVFIDDVDEVENKGSNAVTFESEHDGKRVICVALRGEQPDKVWAHEAAHVASFYCFILGIEFTPRNDEAYAYLTEWAYGCIKEFYNENK